MHTKVVDVKRLPPSGITATAAPELVLLVPTGEDNGTLRKKKRANGYACTPFSGDSKLAMNIRRRASQNPNQERKSLELFATIFT
jgi:hypothetical protein